MGNTESLKPGSLKYGESFKWEISKTGSIQNRESLKQNKVKNSFNVRQQLLDLRLNNRFNWVKIHQQIAKHIQLFSCGSKPSL